ncbi:Gag-pol [Phytophthora megakarya]|uniref:Gag-pol n=1 Tax=Phytophthora megakarya TaxID=4795 RepID=A0A225VAG7_9STRA|nr:Gag-pol [Phytophthora megakarya]
MPTSIVTDRGRKFVSAFWQHVFKSIGTKLSMTVVHRAQGDGQAERMDRILEEYLRSFVGLLQDDWDVHLANAEFASIQPEASTIGSGSRRKNLKPYPSVVVVLSFTSIKRLYSFAVVRLGDRAYLSTQNLDRKHTGLPNSTKFGPKWIGPYTVTRKIHNCAYELNIQSGNNSIPSSIRDSPNHTRNLRGCSDLTKSYWSTVPSINWSRS